MNFGFEYQEDDLKVSIDFKDAKTKHLIYLVDNITKEETVKILRKLRNQIRELNLEIEKLERER